MRIELFKKYRLFLIVILINLFLYLYWPLKAELSVEKSWKFLLEVLKILPPIMLLMGLMEVWLSRTTIEKYLGEDSGAKGAIVSMLLGSVAAGPLFAAFPLAISLRNKGVRVSNIVIFLGSWATIKIPMLIMESSFISFRFAMLRLLITIPFIFGIGYIMEKNVELI